MAVVVYKDIEGPELLHVFPHLKPFYLILTGHMVQNEPPFSNASRPRWAPVEWRPTNSNMVTVESGKGTAGGEGEGLGSRRTCEAGP